MFTSYSIYNQTSYRVNKKTTSSLMFEVVFFILLCITFDDLSEGKSPLRSP
jgi:hypothetical protein